MGPFIHPAPPSALERVGLPVRKYLLFRSMARKRAQVLPDMWVRSPVPTYHGGGELMLTVVTRDGVSVLWGVWGIVNWRREAGDG